MDCEFSEAEDAASRTLQPVCFISVTAVWCNWNDPPE